MLFGKILRIISKSVLKSVFHFEILHHNFELVFVEIFTTLCCIVFLIAKNFSNRLASTADYNA